MAGARRPARARRRGAPAGSAGARRGPRAATRGRARSAHPRSTRVIPAAPPARWERAGLVLAFVLCAALAWPLRDYVTDDTFIHLQYARHVAHGEGFVFNPGERVYGSTSPLWVLLLAGGMRLGFDGLAVAKVLGALATLAALLLW